MNDNDIEITLDNDNENIDVDREESIYTNISEEEINEIRAGIQTNTNDISNIKAEQTTQNQNIQTNTSNIERNTTRIRVLESDSGNKVSLNINSNYVMTLQLLNKDNEVLSTGTIDLPIESMVVNASYSNGILTLTLQNGQTLDVDISDIVSGLVSETTFNDAVSRLDGLINGLSRRMTSAEEEINDIKDDITDIKTEQTQQNTNINKKVDKVAGKGLSTEDYTTAEKNKLEGLENYDDTEVRGYIQENTYDISELEVNTNNLSNDMNKIFNSSFNKLDDYITIMKNKEINVVSGIVAMRDSSTSYVVLIDCSIYDNSCLVGTTNKSSNYALFLDENKYKISQYTSSGFPRNTVVKENAKYIAFSYNNDIDYDISAVSYLDFAEHINDNNINGYKSESGNNLIFPNSFSHGSFSSSNISWNAVSVSTNLFQVLPEETVSFNMNLINNVYLIILDSSLTYISRTNIAPNSNSEVKYTNNSNETIYAYVCSQIIDISNLIAVKGSYSKNELNNMDTGFLNNHISANVIPYDLTNKIVKSSNVITPYFNKVFSALGDSLTAEGSGGHYVHYIKNYLKLNNYKQCAIGGTRVSGTNENAFWQDVRINDLDINSQIVTIMGGTNDIGKNLVITDNDFNIENYDVTNFVGAYNVMISKIFYKFLQRSEGYYQDINYSGITQVEEVNPNFRTVLITPPAIINSNYQEAQLFGDYVKRIGRMWGLPVVDSFGEMQMNFMTYPEGATDMVHFGANFHKKLAEIIIGKLKSIEPIE